MYYAYYHLFDLIIVADGVRKRHKKNRLFSGTTAQPGIGTRLFPSVTDEVEQ